MIPPVFQDFLIFLRSPSKAESYTKMPAGGFLVLLLVALALAIPFSVLLEWLGVNQFDSLLEKMLAENKMPVVFAVIFLAPLLEEPIFRLHLDLKITSIWWGLGLSILMISQQWYVTAVFIVYLVYLLLKVFRHRPPNLKFVIYTSSTFFALIHLGNFSNFELADHFYWIPFLVAAQFFIGLILSYIRLTYGIWYAILFHAVYNAILIIPSVYFYEP
ncbi:membrane protease YdiL (CAAX protease family) [Algoriphagus sp. 4150]|uniref:CPBP family glutamic-type intramembrane protease n=1 Tax=Algoriphagus sp. 4150 TaxID=2817756 RepID=UPI00286352D1|nr:CPBP family glutamic-type intramembrane protease [Algoriphagus sp. 4150]MDR7129933.1 membrane protease YdiL (CAAX protease family) [Algoriphagus sp. 4150]